MLTRPAVGQRLLAPPESYPPSPPRSLVARSGDVLMLVGFALAPVPALGIGGREGVSYSDIVLGLAALARGLYVLTEGLPRRALHRHSVLLALLGLFVLSGFLGSVAHDSTPLAWPYLRLVIATVGSVLLVLTFGDDERARWRLLQAYGFGTILLAISSFYGPVGQGRHIGYTIHPNALGHSCMIGCAVSVWLWDNATTRGQRWLWGGAAVLNVLAIQQSGSRGGFLGFAVGALVYLALRGRSRLTLAVVGATWLLAMSMSSGLLHLPASNPIQRLVSEGTENYGSNASRRELLKGNFDDIDRDPMWGAGFEDDYTVISVHVVYLQAWIGAGALGAFVVILVGITMLFLPLLSRRRDLALACGGVAISIAWLFTNILSARDQWIYIAIVFGMLPSVFGSERSDGNGRGGPVHHGPMPPRTTT